MSECVCGEREREWTLLVVCVFVLYVHVFKSGCMKECVNVCVHMSKRILLKISFPWHNCIRLMCFCPTGKSSGFLF